MERPMTLGASEALKIRAVNPDQIARHHRIIGQNNAWSQDRGGSSSLSGGGTSATSVFTTEQTRIFTASIILLGWKPCGRQLNHSN